MASKSKSSKDEWGNKIEMPSIPSAQTVTPEEPHIASMGSYTDFYNQVMQAQIAQYPNLIRSQISMMPEIGAADIAYAQQVNPAMTQLDIQRNMALLPADLQRQQQMMGGAFSEQTREAGLANQFMYGQANQYGQAYTDLFNQYTASTNPQFMPAYNQLGQSVQSELAAGYNLGEGLTREVQQAMRGQQAASGNYMGPAITAQEAYGTGEAAVNLYNSRVANSQNFLNGQQPGDLWGKQGLTMPALQMPTVQSGYYPDSAGQATLSQTSGPNANFVQNVPFDTGQAASVFSNYNATDAQMQSNYNTALIQATGVNNEGMFNAYDKSFDQFLYNEGVAHGLYDTPSAPNTSSAQTASIVGGVASGVGSAAAASAAAAAFCWLARRVLPDRWQEWRAFLFTEAPDALRRFYICHARRLAQDLTDGQIEQIRPLMTACLRKR